jgi:YidC/Oxa1 family membrane protein insertase|tara:strand:+ start:2115 stop:3818 length:1704 start_codon:yes stop_codon:yes gene_type:complete
MENQKNLFLAIAISMAIIFGFQFLMPPEAPVENTTTNKNVDTGVDLISNSVPTINFENKEKVLLNSERVSFNNGKIAGSINLTGAIIDDLVLLDYREFLDINSAKISFLNPVGSEDAYYLDTGWASNDKNINFPNSDSIWSANRNSLNGTNSVTLSWTSDQNITFEKSISLDENYLFNVEQKIINQSGLMFEAYPYGSSNRKGEPEMQKFFILHEGPISITDSVLKEYSYEDLRDDQKIKFSSEGGWIGITDKYWQTAIIPLQNEKITQTYSYEFGQDTYQTNIVGTKISVASNSQISHNFKLFAGPKIVKVIDGYMEEYEIKEFDRSVDFGWLYFLTKPIFNVLQFIYGYVGNFGYAIMLFTLLMRICFFPLAQQSFKSMAKMKKLAPEMKRLKEQYGDDKAGLQKEMMALYKKEKANPIAGCLPILLQIPVFFALYKVLFVTIEMRHAPFIGWIHDLSAPDPLGLLTAFGLFDYDVGAVPIIGGILLMINIGVWPILMGLSMFLQQKLNPQPVDKVQAKIFMFLPLVFTFVLGGFAAGLVIYWTTNNVLSMAQQYVIQRQVNKTS